MIFLAVFESRGVFLSLRFFGSSSLLDLRSSRSIWLIPKELDFSWVMFTEAEGPFVGLNGSKI